MNSLEKNNHFPQKKFRPIASNPLSVAGNNANYEPSPTTCIHNIVICNSSRPKTAQENISFWHAEAFVQAAAHARELGFPLHYHLTAKWPVTENNVDPHGVVRRELSRWLKRKYGKSCFIWVRETCGGDHTHFLLYLNQRDARRLRKRIVCWVKRTSGLASLPRGTISLTKVWSFGDPDKHVRTRVRYLLKSASQSIRNFFKTGRKSDPGCIDQKSLGWSQPLSSSARSRDNGVQISMKE
jgi:hypothetical protein